VSAVVKKKDGFYPNLVNLNNKIYLQKGYDTKIIQKIINHCPAFLREKPDSHYGQRSNYLHYKYNAYKIMGTSKSSFSLTPFLLLPCFCNFCVAKAKSIFIVKHANPNLK
jgi:hypothetical protein